MAAAQKLLRFGWGLKGTESDERGRAVANGSEGNGNVVRPWEAERDE